VNGSLGTTFAFKATFEAFATLGGVAISRQPKPDCKDIETGVDQGTEQFYNPSVLARAADVRSGSLATEEVEAA
jgi:hypothetical protein